MSSTATPSPSEKRKLTQLRHIVLRWSDQQGRAFPWRRENASTYEKIVVEVLLQRTTATAVLRFYDSFFSRFPSWEALANVCPQDLEALLKPLGLWRRRASSLLGLARYAVSTGGLFPNKAADHAAIPAVGQYVSNAILLFQHGIPKPLVDVNMARVIERYVKPRTRADIRYDPWLQMAAHWLTRGRQAVDVNWAILDFAALVCRKREPLCDVCPLQGTCSFALGAAQQATAVMV